MPTPAIQDFLLICKFYIKNEIKILDLVWHLIKLILQYHGADYVLASFKLWFSNKAVALDFKNKPTFHSHYALCSHCNTTDSTEFNEPPYNQRFLHLEKIKIKNTLKNKDAT